MNTFTQKQMTTGRDAFGLSLLAGKVLMADRFGAPAAADSRHAGCARLVAPHFHCAPAVHPNFRREQQACREHAHTIRGGNP